MASRQATRSVSADFCAQAGLASPAPAVRSIPPSTSRLRIGRPPFPYAGESVGIGPRRRKAAFTGSTGIAGKVPGMRASLADIPVLPDGLSGLRWLGAGMAELLTARAGFEAALSGEGAQVARYGLWQVCQILGDADAAERHLQDAIAACPLVRRPARRPERRVLALAVPGDFQANLPLDPLLDARTTDLCTLWITQGDPLPDLPPFDCVFIAIAEDGRHAQALAAADRIAESLPAPVINCGAKIASLSRDGAARLLRDLPDTIVPRQVCAGRDDLAALVSGGPIIVRPSGSHAGRGLARLSTAPDAARYCDSLPKTQTFFAAPFIDYRSPDGFWRKYRVIFVDGEPFPYHLAIHDDWMVWYYNAGMERSSCKRAEEARFLADITSAFPPSAMQALRGIATRVGLDVFGLDCSVMPDGRLLVFEVETGMIVHDADPAALYPYKKQYVPRIFRAMERMIDKRIGIEPRGR
jgi:hypothetical protein